MLISGDQMFNLAQARMTKEQDEKCRMILSYNYALIKLGLPALATPMPRTSSYDEQQIMEACLLLRSHVEADYDIDARLRAYHDQALRIIRNAGKYEDTDFIAAFEQCCNEFYGTVLGQPSSNTILIDFDTIANASNGTTLHEISAISAADNTQGTEVIVNFGASAPENSSAKDAINAFHGMFPNGCETIPVSGEGLLCAFRAISASLAAIAETRQIPVPTVNDLQSVLQTDTWTDLMKQFGAEDFDLTNENYFSVDQAALAAQMWAEKEFCFAIRLGYLLPDSVPQLVSYGPLDPEGVWNPDNPQIYFIYNNNVEAINDRAINHFSGLKPKAVDNPDDVL